MTGATPGRPRTLVVGLGSVDRGDDGIGPEVAARVAAALVARGDHRVEVVAHEDPTALVERMADRDTVIVVDAVRSGRPPGTVTLIEVGPEPLGSVRPGPAGTHGLGLGTALELARALDRLPPRVAVVGIEAAAFEHGRPVTGAVRAAIPDAVAAVLAALADRDEGRPRPAAPGPRPDRGRPAPT